MGTFRVVHYLNQFFAGVGGEEKADVAPSVKAGATGPGVLLQQLLREHAGSDVEVVGTVVCGDNRMSERTDETLPEVIAMIRGLEPQMLVAGPAFASGRYGIACAAVCAAARRALGIPVITAMAPENPGVEGRDTAVIAAVSGETAASTRADLERVARLAAKLRRGEPLGAADVDGYLPTGKRVNEFDDRPGAERMVDMLLRKLRRQPFTSEVVVPRFDRVTPAPPIRDLADVLLGIVTTSGIVRQGNPEGVESWRATKWVRYSLAGLDRLAPDDFTCVHGGYDNRHIRANPDRAVPLDVLRDWEKRGKIGRLHPVLYSTVGNVMPVEWARQRGREVAQELRQAGVQAAILTAT